MSSTVILISSDELKDKPDLENDVKPLCTGVEHQGQYVCLYPRSGFLVPLVVLLGERKISYKVEFREK